MSVAATEAQTKFHLSLNVGDLTRSVKFLEALLGVPPAKIRSDYAKFELADPPLVLSLEPRGVAGVGALNHVGFRMANSAALVEAQRRLELAGMPTQREEGVECCYARQTKFWITDPDGTLWEVYVFEEDLDHRGAGQVPLKVLPQRPDAAEPQKVSVLHRLGQSFDSALQSAAGAENLSESVDEFLLQGTFNVSLEAAERRRILETVQQALKPGGQVLVHVLTADRPLTSAPKLPGPTAAVEMAPVDRELLAELESVGLVDIELTKFGESPCFRWDGAELRETKILARKPGKTDSPQRGTVVYKGPFQRMVDDAGHAFCRGERIVVDAATWDRLKAGAAASQFLFLGRTTES
jgi:catechol 2,3-dioxygenase-like lactoylglutathione lyase family enzyme